MLWHKSNIITSHLRDNLFNEKQVELSVLRLDKIDPVVSGNKLFKLHYFLQKALDNNLEGMVTFGGPYSNHLVATAYACRQAGLKSAGIVRGEQPASLSHTLQACLQYGMQLTFISRQQYELKETVEFQYETSGAFKNFLVVPEGGYHPLGAEGAALIMDLIDEDVTHICCAAGTLTTVAGLYLMINATQQIVCIPVLKNMHDLPERMARLTGLPLNPERLKIINDYHFGGYAKKTPELISFMNSLYRQHQLPSDFVYTGKMMFGVFDLIEKDFFNKGSKIVCLHTGGLQGNLSLSPGTLLF
ncbi:MAG: pyridoxal-phosphate dependent enzyme [Aquabacterium sp.]|nr:pyridoxal-phosphate dependent enzyme [Ferruginibacter sp.]